MDSKLGDPYIRFDHINKGIILVHSNPWFDLILMLFWVILYLIDENISIISQNNLHVLHNSYTCQTCKIIGVNIELVILAFILLPLGHANFECQQLVAFIHSPRCWRPLFPILLVNFSGINWALHHVPYTFYLILTNSTKFGSLRCFAGLCSEYAKNNTKWSIHEDGETWI
jgi:hypothetical protein